MNGTAKKRIPKFLEGELIPKGYFEPVNPYVSAPSCNINLGKLVAYAKAQGKSQWDLTKEEVRMFENT